jgi:hypothetical protein
VRYPAELEQPGLLRDGRSVFIRPVRAADELDDMFDVALLLANQPVPTGNRVAIVTNALDPGVLAAAWSGT